MRTILLVLSKLDFAQIHVQFFSVLMKKTQNENKGIRFDLKQRKKTQFQVKSFDN